MQYQPHSNNTAVLTHDAQVELLRGDALKIDIPFTNFIDLAHIY